MIESNIPRGNSNIEANEGKILSFASVQPVVSIVEGKTLTEYVDDSG
jgi:hypothetical protein